MTSPPRISVLMPVRDGRFLGPALGTIRAQTLTDLEIVLIDDARDPETRTALAAAARDDKRIRLLRHTGDSGLAAVLNSGLAECRAPLIARADADDVYHADRLALQYVAFAARPSLAALSSGWRRIDEAGRPLFTHRPVQGPRNVRFRTMFGGPLLHPGAMIRTEALRAVGGYDPAFWTAQDSDLWVRMVAAGMKLDNLSEPLVDWRQHDRSVVAARGAEGRALGLSIAVRAQSAYLGETASNDAVSAAVETLSGSAPTPLDRLAVGERHLARLRARAQGGEPRSMILHFDRAVAEALARQARWALRSGCPGNSARLFRRALRWHLGIGASRAAPAAMSARTT